MWKKVSSTVLVRGDRIHYRSVPGLKYIARTSNGKKSGLK